MTETIEDRIEAGVARLRERAAAEVEPSPSLYGPIPDAVRHAMIDWPTHPKVAAAFRKCRVDSAQCYRADWPLLVKAMPDLLIAKLLAEPARLEDGTSPPGVPKKGWLTHHDVRVAIAQVSGKRARCSSRIMLEELNVWRENMEARLIEAEERAKLEGDHEARMSGGRSSRSRSRGATASSRSRRWRRRWRRRKKGGRKR